MLLIFRCSPSWMCRASSPELNRNTAASSAMRQNAICLLRRDVLKLTVVLRKAYGGA